MAHLLSSSSSVCQTPISTSSLHPPKQYYKAPSLNQRLHSLRNKDGLIHGYPLELKGGVSCLQPLGFNNYHNGTGMVTGNRSWFQKHSTAIFSDLRETVVNEGEKVSWIDTFLPRWSRPYAHLARLDWPTLLFVWPFMW